METLPPEMFPALPEVGCRWRNKKHQLPQDRARKRSKRKLRSEQDKCVLPKLEILRNSAADFANGVKLESLLPINEIPVVPDSTSKTLGVLSQLRWEASNGKRILQVGVAKAGALKDEAVMAEMTEAGRLGSSNGGGVRSLKNCAELRSFFRIMEHELEECLTPQDLDALQLNIAKSICCSSPGVSGNFVSFSPSHRRHLLRSLSKATQFRKTVLQATLAAHASLPMNPRRGNGLDDSTSKRVKHKMNFVAHIGGMMKRSTSGDQDDVPDTGLLHSRMVSKGVSKSSALPSVDEDVETASRAPTKEPRQDRVRESVTTDDDILDLVMPGRISAKLQRRPSEQGATKRQSVLGSLSQPRGSVLVRPIGGINESNDEDLEPTVQPTVSPTGKGSAKNRRQSHREQHRDDVALWSSLFRKYRDEGEIHHDYLGKVLDQLGFVNPNTEWIDEIFEEFTKYRTIDEETYYDFIKAYGKRQEDAYAEAFRECDADGSGFLSESEITGLLKSLEFDLMSHVLKDLLEEVEAGSDEDGSVCLNSDGFKELMDLVRMREGFSQSEYKDFCDAFRRYDRDDSGEIDRKEFVGILNWLGYPCDADLANLLLDEVDEDASGLMNLRELVRCMKKLSEQKIESVKEAIDKADEDGNGTLSFSEFFNVFVALGYAVDMEAIEDACRDAGMSPAELEDGIDLTELWRLHEVYRRREGLTAEQSKDIEYIFGKTDKENIGEISTLGVGAAIRWLGCMIPFEQQQKLISEVDIDDSGLVDLPEFRKLIRMCYEKEMDAATHAFEEALKEQEEDDYEDCLDDGEEGTITLKQARNALEQISCTDEAGYCLIDINLLFPMASTLSGHGVDLPSFMAAAKKCKKIARKRFRERGGFNLAEISVLKEEFIRFDKDNSGDIGKRELINLIEHVFPDMAHSKAQRPRLRRLIEEADADGSGTIDLDEYIRLMGQLREIHDNHRLQKEKAATRMTGFSKTEVKEFRELFLSSDADGDGTLTFEEVERMINKVCPLGAKNTAELNHHFQSIVTVLREENSSYRLSADSAADFPEFLLLMHKLLETDFAQISQRTKNICDAAGAAALSEATGARQSLALKKQKSEK